MKYILSIIISLIVLVYILQPKQSLNPVKHAQSCSVTIHAGSGWGSGVVKIVKGEVYIWTVNHVLVDKNDKILPIQVINYIYKNGRLIGQSSIEAEVINRSKELDLALLKLKHNINLKESVIFYKGTTIPLGTELWGVGSQYGNEYHNTTVKGILSQYYREFDNRYLDQADISVYPGASGGGIFLENGQLIGLIDAMRNINICLYIPVSHIRGWAESIRLDPALYQ